MPYKLISYVDIVTWWCGLKRINSLSLIIPTGCEKDIRKLFQTKQFCFHLNLVCRYVNENCAQYSGILFLLPVYKATAILKACEESVKHVKNGSNKLILQKFKN